MSLLFDKYPKLQALTDRKLFLQGRLSRAYGIIWNDDLDIEAETIHEGGTTIRTETVPIPHKVAHALSSARAKVGLSQTELATLTSIDQSNISKIERGIANPSVNTLDRLATALQMDLQIVIA